MEKCQRIFNPLINQFQNSQPLVPMPQETMHLFVAALFWKISVAVEIDSHRNDVLR